MARTLSTMMMPLGETAPDFHLPDPRGRVVRRDDFRGAPALLVIFMCNHCPYVKHVELELARLIPDYQRKGVAVVGIMSNDVAQYPDDAPDKMLEFLARHELDFPYLHDEAQAVAKAYRAACTPDFFLFDRERRLAYRGQMDNSRPGGELPVTGVDLRAALDAVLAGRPVAPEQKPSMGCNIKWRAGNEPGYPAA